MVSERGAFVFADAQTAENKAERFSLVGVFLRNIQPVSARLNNAKIGQAHRQDLHAVVFGAVSVIDGDFAHFFLSGYVVKAAFGIGNIGSLHIGEEGLCFRFVVRAPGGAEQRVGIGYGADGIERAENILRGEIVAAQSSPL